MNIIWDSEKNDWLILNRGISFEEIADKILNEDYLEILENPTNKNQQYFVMGIDNYTWVCLLYTSPSPRDGLLSRMPSSA